MICFLGQKLILLNLLHGYGTQELNYYIKKEKESKQQSLFKNLRKEVETGANGTQKYVIKKGNNKGKIANVK